MKEEMTTERPLWTLPCASRDAVLWTSFTLDELTRLAKAVGCELHRPCRCSLDEESRLMSAVHQACHEENTFSASLQRMLDARHAAAMEWISGLCPDHVLDACSVPFEELPVPVAALLWAVAADPREDLRCAEDLLVWRLQTRGIRAWAFGKVEVIEV